MAASTLPSDPFNLVITGVGGQGNVMASRVLGNILTRKGFTVTIGETFGASQRGGSVMSHLRVSEETTWSPQIPKGRAHAVIALEPTEAVRVLADYGNPGVYTLCNTRPVHSIAVISGESAYPEQHQVKQWLRDLSERAWFLEATNAAMEMGNAILANIMMIGALSATGLLPVDSQGFEAVISRSMPADKAARNCEAFDIGAEMLRAADRGQSVK
ncbi:MAG: 2-oxoacid:acceptor oxidoreductase family protein [Desulfobacterales bacterium]|nr:2-oxoacid:acceptor oxidoreductase family protein [Desulfobacterales bacterium]MBS3756414.1 2-oxoacid:acceptor oxidoreductase family protein [Desulfobacterales bacterium]